jgi:hypothetical protein
LLRAFDDGRARVTSWASAKTVNTPLAEIAEAAASVAEGQAGKAPAGPVERGEPKTPPSPPGWFARLARPSTWMKKVAALVVALAVVVSAGTLLGRGVAKRARPKPSPTAAAPARPAATGATAAKKATEPPATPAPEPPTARAPAVALVAEAAAPAEEIRAPRPTPADNDPSHETTLARQAVDALLAGDRPTALRHYRELSRKEPGRGAYREAVRLLAASASTTPP